MEFVVLVKLLLLLLLFLLPIYFLIKDKKHNHRLPPGSLGLPLIGQSLDLLQALKADKVEKWFQKRITKHGPISKANLFGYPTIVLHGPSANKFIYTCDGNVLTNTQPPSISRILGSKNIIELSGHDHKRVRAALVSFLKLEVLKQYVAKVDEEIQHHLQTHWHGKHELQVQPLIKTLTFNVICSLLFGIERGPKRKKLLPLFQDMIGGTLAVPINLPYTQFNRGIVARKKLVPMLVDLIQEKRNTLKEQKQLDPNKDLITSLLSIRDDDDSLKTMSDEEIIDNIIVVMIAGYDTTSVLVTFLIKLLATNKSVYSTILQVVLNSSRFVRRVFQRRKFVKQVYPVLLVPGYATSTKPGLVSAGFILRGHFTPELLWKKLMGCVTGGTTSGFNLYLTHSVNPEVTPPVFTFSSRLFCLLHLISLLFVLHLIERLMATLPNHKTGGTTSGY